VSVKVCTSLARGLICAGLIVGCAAGALAQSLPAPWIAEDVGNPAVAGSSSWANGIFTVTGAGEDIWNRADEFHFVYQPMQGDIEIIVRVDSLTEPHDFAKGGVMIRETLAAGSPNVLVAASPANGWTYQRRRTPGADSIGSGSLRPPGKAPGWVRLVRAGDVFTGYYSPDGVAWTQINSDTVVMAPTVYVGLAVTSNVTTTTATATFSNLRLVGGEDTEPQPPTVSITSPANGATFTAPASITITANAADSDGTVARVDFSRNGQAIGSDTSAPYGVTWSNVPAGSYTLTAVAHDDAGATASSSVDVTVNGVANQPPTASITSPASGASFTAPATITVTAAAADQDGAVSRVDFFRDGQAIGSDTTAPYSVTWSNVAAGTYSLTATSFDDDGASATSAAVTVTVNGGGNQPPVVAITTPANGATYTAPASITIVASASDSDGTITRVDFFRDGQTHGTEASAPYDENLSNVPAGTYVFTVRATDNSGAVTTSAPVTVTVSGAANQPPTVAITSPANGATYTAPASIAITASAADGNGTVARVDFFRDGQAIGSDTTAPYGVTWSSVAAGTYALTARATDNGGAVTTSAPVTVTVNAAANQPPTVAITSPANGATFTAPASITIAANATDSDGTVARVDFFRDGQSIGSDTSAPYSVTWSNVAAGTYALTARATDNTGAATTSAAVTVTVNAAANQPPTVAITSPANGATFTAPASITIAANAADGDGTVARVDFFRDGQAIGSDTTAPYGVTWSSVPAGTYALTARATDNAGAVTTSAAVTVTVGTVQPPPPTPTSIAFNPSPDHDTGVTSYSVALYRSGDPVTATPAATKNLGKPAPANGDITVDISDIVNPLAAGSYYAVVTATGAGGSSSSLPSAPFTK
jgi:hypothetical protein